MTTKMIRTCDVCGTVIEECILLVGYGLPECLTFGRRELCQACANCVENYIDVLARESRQNGEENARASGDKARDG